MAKKPENMEELIEQEIQIVTGSPDSKKSPPVSFRTRGGRSKIPTIKINDQNDNIPAEALIKEENPEVENEEPVLISSDSEPQQDSEQEAEPDQDKADKHAEEVAEMTNDQLKERLTTLGIAIGPIVPSTRKIYEKKLVNVMNKAELQYSTDEDESVSVGAIAEEVKEEAPPVPKQKKEKRGRPKKDQTTVQDKFSDDEELPVVKNSSSARRRSARNAKKSAEQVAPEEPIAEEPEEQVENGSVPIVVENGTGDAGMEQVKEQIEEPEVEPEVEKEEEAQTETEQTEEVPQPTNPIPYHTIAVVLILAILLGLIWKQRDQHIQLVESIFGWMVSKYTSVYDSLMPDVEQLPPIEDSL